MNENCPFSLEPGQGRPFSYLNHDIKMRREAGKKRALFKYEYEWENHETKACRVKCEDQALAAIYRALWVLRRCLDFI